MPAVVEAAAPVKAATLRSTLAVPAVIAGAGDHAARRFLEFFAATIRNKNTRMAYYRAACHFFAWVEQHEIGELADIEPIHVAAYIRGAADDGRQADRQAAPGRDPHAVRLAGRRPGPRRQPGARGARAQACRQARQDAGAHRGPGPAAARERRGREEDQIARRHGSRRALAGGPARPRADRR